MADHSGEAKTTECLLVGGPLHGQSKHIATVPGPGGSLHFPKLPDDDDRVNPDRGLFEWVRYDRSAHEKSGTPVFEYNGTIVRQAAASDAPQKARIPYERFTDRARKAMQLANQEAQLLNHEYIGTEGVDDA